MALNKSIESGKEHRKPYRGAKAIDPACARGDCPGCRDNKTYAVKKQEMKADYKDE